MPCRLSASTLTIRWWAATPGRSTSANAFWPSRETDFEGTIAASVSFYAAGRLYRSDWFRFDVEIERGRFEKIEPVTLPARRVRVLATRQADTFRRQMVKDVVHETVGAKKEQMGISSKT